MLRLKSKVSHKDIEVIKNKYYELEKVDNIYILVYKNKVTHYFYKNPRSHRYIWSFFYTKEELRIQKIKDLLK
jgi:hypothetical protein